MFTCGKQLKFWKISAYIVRCDCKLLIWNKVLQSVKWLSVILAYLLWFWCQYFYVAVCDRKEHALSPHYYLTKWTPPNKGISDLKARSAHASQKMMMLICLLTCAGGMHSDWFDHFMVNICCRWRGSGGRWGSKW